MFRQFAFALAAVLGIVLATSAVQAAYPQVDLETSAG